MNFIYATGLDLKEGLLDPKKAQALLENGIHNKFILKIGEPELIVDAIPTPKHKKSLDTYLFKNEKDKFQHIRNLDKIRKAIKMNYESKIYSLFLEKMSDTEKLYLRGPRINTKFRGKSSITKHKDILKNSNRNVHTACYNTRIKVNNYKRSSPHKNAPISSACLKRELNYYPPDTSDSFSIRRPNTKQCEKRKSDLNQTFVPYYENKADENLTKKKFSKGRLSTSGVISKPKTVHEWRIKKLKSNTKVIYRDHYVELCFSTKE